MMIMFYITAMAYLNYHVKDWPISSHNLDLISTPIGARSGYVGIHTEVEHDDRKIFLILHDSNRSGVMLPNQFFSHDVTNHTEC